MAPSTKFMQCLHFAAYKHRYQRRKDHEHTPYINHPIRVATILSTEAGITDETILMAALLHDTVEDTDATFDEIADLFGFEVCQIVREMTDDKSLPKEERKRLQIINAANASPQAKLIKLADKLDNLRDLQKALPMGWTQERRQEYFYWAKQVTDRIRPINRQLEFLLDEILKKFLTNH